jgi:hypothetical protein
VVGSSGMTEPVGVPPSGTHVPGVYANGPIALLSSGSPWTSTHTGDEDVIVIASTKAEHVVSL